MTEDQMKKLKLGTRVRYRDGDTGTVTQAMTLKDYLEVTWDDGTIGEFGEIDRGAITRMKHQDR